MKATPRNLPLFAVILAAASLAILMIANLSGQSMPYLTVAPTGTNQLLITVINSNSATYYLQTTPVLANTNYPWTIITNGTQTNFTVNVGPYADSFYRVGGVSILASDGLTTEALVGDVVGAADETTAGSTFYHYTTNPNLAGQGLNVGSGVTSVGNLNASEAMFQLGIDPPTHVYPVTLQNPLDYISINTGAPIRNGLPIWSVEVPTPPGSVGLPTLVPRAP